MSTVLRRDLVGKSMLHVVFEHCPEATIVTGEASDDILGGRICCVNEAFSQKTGFLAEEMEGQLARLFFTGEVTVPGWNDPVKEPIELNLKLRCKDGTETPMRALVWRIYDPVSGQDYLVLQNRVDTEAADTSPFSFRHTSMIATDLDGKVTAWSPGATWLTGYTADQMLGRNVQLLYPEESRSLFDQKIGNALRKEGVVDIDVPLRRQDGTISHVALSLAVVPDRSAVPTRVVGAGVKVTDLKLCESALRESNELLNNIRQLQNLFISEPDLEVVMGEALSMLLSLTDSEHGFIGEVYTDELGSYYLGTHSIRTRSKDPDVLDFFQKHSHQVEFRRPDSLVADVVRRGEPVIGDASLLDARGGLPAGHPVFTAFLGAPLRTRDKTLGAVGLANRPGGYDRALLEKIQPLLDCCATFIEVCKARNRAETNAAMFRRHFAKSQEAFVITSLEGTIIDWNAGATRMLGYAKDEVVGKNFAALYKHARELETIRFTAVQEGCSAGEVAFEHTHGGEVVGQIVLFPIDKGYGEALMWVIRDVTAQKRAEQDLQEASERFQAFARNARVAFWVISADGTSLYFSPVLETITGMHGSEVSGLHNWTALVHPDDRPRFSDHVEACFRGTPARLRYRIIRGDGAIRWLQDDTFQVRNAKGEIYCFAGILEDVTDQQEAEARLRTALEEKEALLKEIHHRVKNNLQIISSLLRLQTSTADPASVSLLRESRNRVDTIALLHEHLYQSENLSRIDFQSYTKRLVANLVGMHEISPEVLRVNVDVDPLTFDTQIAMLCGLILNELVYNSLRHAFPGGRRGQIDVRVKARGGENLVIMSVSDNGVGLPSGFDIERVHTLGLKLVRQLTRQLKGTMSVSNHTGLTVQIKFPLEPSL